MTNQTTIQIKQDPEKIVEKEVLATSIVKISDALIALRKTGLNRTGIIALLHDATKLPKRDIILVLTELEALKKNYTTL